MKFEVGKVTCYNIGARLTPILDCWLPDSEETSQSEFLHPLLLDNCNGLEPILQDNFLLGH
jgi:hypothetical protein